MCYKTRCGTEKSSTGNWESSAAIWIRLKLEFETVCAQCNNKLVKKKHQVVYACSSYNCCKMLCVGYLIHLLLPLSSVYARCRSCTGCTILITHADGVDPWVGRKSGWEGEGRTSSCVQCMGFLDIQDLNFFYFFRWCLEFSDWISVPFWLAWPKPRTHTWSWITDS